MSISVDQWNYPRRPIKDALNSLDVVQSSSLASSLSSTNVSPNSSSSPSLNNSTPFTHSSPASLAASTSTSMPSLISCRRNQGKRERKVVSVLPFAYVFLRDLCKSLRVRAIFGDVQRWGGLLNEGTHSIPPVLLLPPNPSNLDSNSSSSQTKAENLEIPSSDSGIGDDSN